MRAEQLIINQNVEKYTEKQHSQLNFIMNKTLLHILQRFYNLEFIQSFTNLTEQDLGVIKASKGEVHAQFMFQLTYVLAQDLPAAFDRVRCGFELIQLQFVKNEDLLAKIQTVLPFCTGFKLDQCYLGLIFTRLLSEMCEPGCELTGKLFGVWRPNVTVAVVGKRRNEE
jgi:hypothetical protein